MERQTFMIDLAKLLKPGRDAEESQEEYKLRRKLAQVTAATPAHKRNEMLALIETKLNELPR